MDYIAGVYFLIEGIRDIRRKQIHPGICLCFGIFGLIGSIVQGRGGMSLFMAGLPGCICLMISLCSRQAIGYGDGIFLCGLGMIYTLEEMVFMCMIALFLAGTTGLVLLVVFQRNGKNEIPFVPFLFAGWILLQMIRKMKGVS